MKINKIIFGATAMLTMGMLASCSNDEPAPGNGNEQGGATRYMAVRIQSVPDLGSRAVTNEDQEEFEIGTEQENAIAAADLRFFFFDKDGQPYTVDQTILAEGNVANSNMVTPTSINQELTDGKATGIKGVLVLHIPEGAVTTPPAKVVCVANIDEANNYANLDLATLMTKTQATPTFSESTKFAMTSSTYMEGNNVVNYTDVSNKLQTSQSAAEENPAEIFVERLAVKIRPDKDKTFTQTYTVMKRNDDGSLSNEEFKFDNGTAKIGLQVTLTGWTPINTADKAYALKNIANVSDPFTGWNNAGLHRCYWANVPADMQVTNTTYDIHTGTGFTTGTFYTYENTSADNTKMIVKGFVHKEGETEGFDFVKWGGLYYTLDNFKGIVAANAKIKNEDGSIKEITAADVELVEDATLANTYKVQVDGEDVPTYTGIYWWQNGETSYVVDIEHFGNKLAVVRNHIYDYKFNNLIGLGIPGNTPTTPEVSETYLAASIYVLNWRLVNHDITLE